MGLDATLEFSPLATNVVRSLNGVAVRSAAEYERRAGVCAKDNMMNVDRTVK